MESELSEPDEAGGVPPVVTSDWLADRLGRLEIAIVHVATSMGGTPPLAPYADAHLPGARLLVLDDVLADPAGPIVGRHPLPTPAAFARTLSSVGIGDEVTVVAYDDRNGGWAARLVWMLRIIGQSAALLDGGLPGWTGRIEQGRPPPTRSAARTIVDWPATAIASADDVASHVRAGGVVVDSREADRYMGIREPVDAVAGHIPGAINLPFTDNLVDAGARGGRFRPVPQLRRRFAPLADDDVIVYCGSGITACHNALAIESVGLPRPRVYVGSWSGWSTDPDRPCARGATPGEMPVLDVAPDAHEPASPDPRSVSSAG